MAVTCGVKCAKTILIVFNLLFWLSGCIILGLGVWIFIDPTKAYLFHLVATYSVGKDLLHYLACVLVALGGVVLLVGFVGCCGALQESRCMLVGYFSFLFVLLCAELSVSVITLLYREEYLTGLEVRLTDQLTSRYGHDTSNNNGFTQSVDVAQYKFNCCGVLSDRDYLHTKWWNDSAMSNEPRNVPLTCCILANTSSLEASNAGSPITVVSRVFGGTVEEPWQHPQPKDKTACQATDPTVHKQARHTQGCYLMLEAWFKHESSILIAVGIAVASFQVLGMILSICLCRHVIDQS